MKRANMSEWRTVQLFLSSQAAGVFEVEVDTENRDVRCNCPVFKSKQSCKHSRFVRRKMETNNGHYSIMVPYEVDEELALAASDTPEKFREFVLKYAKVEVL